MITKSLENETTKGVFYIIDIDHFKKINDCYGHYTGDMVLKQIGEILKETFRREDIVGRLGGDEFIIFMRNEVNKNLAIEKCKIIQKKVAAMHIPTMAEAVTLSIGGTMVTNAKDYDVLYQAADNALYQVKNRGRNGFEITG